MWFIGKEPKFKKGTPAMIRLSEGSPIFMFDAPLDVSNLHNYDCTYWYTGMTFSVDIKKLIKSCLSNILSFSETFFKLSAPIIACLLILLFYLDLDNVKRSTKTLISNYWLILIPSLIIFLIYLPIRTELRYIGAYVTLTFLSLFSSITLNQNEQSKKLIKAVTIILSLILTTNILLATLSNAYYRKSQDHTHWIVAQYINAKGIKNKDKVGYIGNLDHTYWARLAKVKITAGWHVPDRNKIAAYPKDIINDFKKAKVKAILSEVLPTYSLSSKWEAINKTGYFLTLVK